MIYLVFILIKPFIELSFPVDEDIVVEKTTPIRIRKFHQDKVDPPN